ncbi:hypothetical protein C8N42_1764, partial [Celeribacter persicus]
LAASALCARHAKPTSGLLLRRPLVGFYSAVDTVVPRFDHLDGDGFAIEAIEGSQQRADLGLPIVPAVECLIKAADMNASLPRGFHRGGDALC